MSEGILESVFGKKNTEPYNIEVMWGRKDVKIPMRTDIGSKEQNEWRRLHENDFRTKNDEGETELDIPLYVAQLLKDFSQVEQFNLAEPVKLADEIDRKMTLSAQMTITDWWNLICGMTNEKISLLASSKDFLQSR